jgi:hypothetical protein
LSWLICGIGTGTLFADWYMVCFVLLPGLIFGTSKTLGTYLILFELWWLVYGLADTSEQLVLSLPNSGPMVVELVMHALVLLILWLCCWTVTCLGPCSSFLVMNWYCSDLPICTLVKVAYLTG